MFLWFVACGALVVVFVFDSRGFDYRIVAAGSVLPLAEDLTGSPLVLHTLSGSVLLLAAVMATTAGRGRRVRRRRWLGLPIGTMVFLVASGSSTRTALFWWPLGGAGGAGHGRPPEFDRPPGVLVALELAGVVAVLWTARRFELANPRRRRELWKTGRMTRPDQRPAGRS